MTRPAPKHARRKRATKKAIALPQQSTGITLPPINVSALIKWVFIAGGLLLGIGKMQADVDHLKDDMSTVKQQVGAIYDHLAFRESGEAGPSTPEPVKGVTE